MKIALVGRYGEGEIVGGPERVARELFSELLKHNSDVTFIEYFFSSYSDYSFLKKIAGRKKISQNMFRLGIIRIVMLIIKEKYDIVHLINIQRFQLVIILFRYIFKPKFISTFHGLSNIELKGRKQFFKKRYFLDKWVENLIIKKSALRIFPSVFLFEEFKKYYRIDNDKYEIIPNAISDEFIEYKQSKIINKNIDLLFYNSLGNLIDKGLDELIRNLSKISEINIRLFILGYSGQEYSMNQNITITPVGLLNPKEFIEFCKDKNFIIKSGAFEPFSIIVVECMALGLIPIITKNVGIKDYIENGINGFFYDFQNTISLSNLFKDIKGNRYNLNLMSTKARETAITLNWTEITKKYLAAYHKVK